MRVGHVGHRLALQPPVGGLAGEREHQPGFDVCFLQALSGGQDLAAPLVDLREPGPGDRGLAACRLDGAGVQLQGDRVGVRVPGAIARMDQVLEGFEPVLSLGEVVRQLLIVLGEPVRVELLQRVAHRPMQGAAALAE